MVRLMFYMLGWDVLLILLSKNHSFCAHYYPILLVLAVSAIFIIMSLPKILEGKPDEAIINDNRWSAAKGALESVALFMTFKTTFWVLPILATVAYLLNNLATAANGWRMPVDVNKIPEYVEKLDTLESSTTHQAVTESTRFLWLCDRFRFRLMPRSGVSIGDIILLVGMAAFTAQWTLAVALRLAARIFD